MRYRLLAALAGIALAAAPAARAQNFATIESPNGGRIITAMLEGSPAAPEALGALLRHLHTLFGRRPETGAVAADPSGRVLGVFFTANLNGDDVAGLAIVGIGPDGRARAAALFDDARRFPVSAPALLESVPTLGAAPPLPLERYVFPDGSGSVALPMGWLPSQAQQGTVVVAGPHGESIVIGLLAPVLDTSNPQVVSMVKMETRAGRPLPGLYTAFAYTDDPVKAFLGVATLFAEKLGKPAPRYTIRSARPRIEADATGFTVIDGEVDAADGHGAKIFAAQVYTMKPSSTGIWGVAVSSVEVPVSLVASEGAIVIAICASYAKNDAVADDASRKRIAAIHPIDAATLAPLRARVDAMDKQIGVFVHDLSDKAVTASADPAAWADALAHADPQHFQAVPLNTLLKGIDY